MKTPERFNRAMKALVQAFFNDTLEPCDSCACAVGNIVAYGANIKLVQEGSNAWGRKSFKRFYNGYDLGAWYSAIMGDFKLTEKAMANCDHAGYSLEELSRIEKAFMENRNGYGNTETEEIFHGLKAVVEVLCEIDGIEPTEYKKAFEYTADFKPVYELSV